MKNFDTFGVMVDCSRGAVPHVEGLKHFFRILAGMGCNMAMLYTEDTYEIEQYHSAYRKCWFSVNKPQGFEVQDIRLGGLIQRMKSCKARLLDYAEGRISEIPELSEEILPLSDPTAYSWSSIVSACGI